MSNSFDVLHHKSVLKHTVKLLRCNILEKNHVFIILAILRPSMLRVVGPIFVGQRLDKTASKKRRSGSDLWGHLPCPHIQFTWALSLH